jgi:Txe/YoeB family toxin of Txe-Axe toxin-antitoxin module
MTKKKLAFSEGTALVPSFSLLAQQTDGIISAVVETLYNLEADPYDILGTKPEGIVWEYPSRWSEKFAAENLVMSASSAASRRPGDATRAILAAQNLVKASGQVPDSLLKDLRYYLGPACNAHAFYTHPHPNAQEYFNIDLVCLLWNASAYKVKTQDEFGIRLRRDMRYPFIGVTKDSKVWNELDEYLTSSRGYLEIKEQDSIDRIYTWTLRQMPDIDLEVFFRQLAMLKLQMSPKVVYKLEQALLTYSPPKFVDPSLAQLMFTDENLEAIRECWVNSKEAKDRLRDLYDAIVPTFADDQQFADMFGLRPFEVKKYTYKVDEKVANGIEKFILFFQSRQRYLKRKRA